MPLVWKVGPLLERHDVSVYRFRLDTKLSSDVAYAIAAGDHPFVTIGVLDKLIPYLRTLTGNTSLQIGDIVEYCE